MTTASPPRRQAAIIGNLLAGTTTAVVIIPQGMAYAMLAGLPAIHGLYASLLPLVAYALIGRSRELAVGPGAVDSLLVGAALAGLAAFDGSPDQATLAATLALMVAAIQLVLGALRAGFVVNFLSRPVLSGFMSAAALTIGFSQMSNLLGFAAERTPRFFTMVEQTVTGIPSANLTTAIVGMACAATLMLLKRWRKRFPRALVVVVASIVASRLLDLEAQGVAVIGAVPEGLPVIGLPELSWATLSALAPTALAIALVGYLTMISIAKTFADQGGYDIDASRELVAASGANALAAVSQGFPVSASFSRSAVHKSAGATSPYALVVTAAWVALTLLFLTAQVYHLPKATLAAIIMTAVFSLIDTQAPRELWRVKRIDMWLLVITFIATLAIGIEPGILIGVACSLAAFIYGTSRPHTAVLGRLGNTPDFRNVANYPDAVTTPGVIVIRIDAQFYFGNVTFLKNLLKRLEADSNVPLRAVVIEACSFTQLDSSADAALQAITRDYQARDVAFLFASVKMPVMRVMRASGLHELVGPEHFFRNVDDALKSLEA